MLHDNPSISTISSNSQATLSSRSIYHRVKLTSGLTISDSTWLDQGNDGKERQWYCSMIKRTRVVKSCNGTKEWCHVRLKMGKSSSLQRQYMYVDMVLLWSEGEMGHSLKHSRSISWSQVNRLNIFHDRSGPSDHDAKVKICLILKAKHISTQNM